MIDTDLEQRLERLRLMRAGLSGSTRCIDTARAWRDLQLLRSRTSRARRRGLGAAALAAAGIAFAGLALAHIGPSHVGSALPGPGGRSRSPGASPRSYPRAVVARIKTGGASAMVQAGNRAWVVSGGRPTPSGHFTSLLTAIDLRTDSVVLRKVIGPYQGAVAAGDGKVWLTTAGGRATGQIQRIDPATGRVIATLRLPAGRCFYVTYASASLWATCAPGGGTAEFFRIDPATGRVRGRSGPVRGSTACWYTQPSPCPIRQIAVADGAVWYINGSLGLSGVAGVGGRQRGITVKANEYPPGFDYHAQSLVSSGGFVWVLTEDESVAKIDPTNGRVVRTYTYRTYDPSYNAGIAYFAVGHGSLWLIAGPGTVLRVSLATGRPVSRIARVVRGLCRYQCGGIYSTPSAIWVPAGRWLVRIDPAKLPG